MPLSLAAKGVLGLVTFGALGAYEIAPQDVRGETVFLERLAVRLACAHQIPPETHKKVSDMLDRSGRSHAKAIRPPELQTRRQVALDRIHDVLRESASSTTERAGCSPI